MVLLRKTYLAVNGEEGTAVAELCVSSRIPPRPPLRPKSSWTTPRACEYSAEPGLCCIAWRLDRFRVCRLRQAFFFKLSSVTFSKRNLSASCLWMGAGMKLSEDFLWPTYFAGVPPLEWRRKKWLGISEIFNSLALSTLLLFPSKTVLLFTHLDGGT